MERDKLRNIAMEECLRWGQDDPLARRVGARLPDLTEQELAALCGEACDAEHAIKDLIYDRYIGPSMADGVQNALKAQIRGDYPWLDDENFRRVFSQGMYEAWHG